MGKPFPHLFMTKLAHYLAAAIALGSTLLLSGCSTDGVADARQSALERRQDRMDARTSARQERWRTRGEHMDARARATLDSW